jgi:twinkle protein
MELKANEQFKFYPHRGLSEGTLRFYDIQTKFRDGEPIETGFPYRPGAFKVRGFNEKTFTSIGDMKTPGLFGKNRFDPGSKESITICEGEYDAPSIFQVTGGNTAGVSVRSSSQAFKDCSTDRDYINSFKRIIICFDNDEQGQKAARQVSSLFDFNKVYHVKFNKHKDANDYLQNSEGPDLYTAWKGARRYSPDNIISQFGQIEDTLNEVKEDKIGEYPFKSLNQHLYGIHKGEIIVIKAGSWAPGKSSSGVGKTEMFRAIEHHFLKTTKVKVGIIHLEEDNATTIKAIAGYELGQPAVLPDSGLSASDIFEGYKKAVGNDDTRVHIYSSFELEDETIFLDNLRFLGTAAGCSVFFLDHITWLGTGLEQEDERRKLDRLSQKLKLLAKELRIAIVMISHTNDEGRTRGSRNIENVANTIIHLTRDKDSPDPVVRNTVHISVEKARLGGRAGPAGKAYFDPYTNVLREFQQEDLIPEKSLVPA